MTIINIMKDGTVIEDMSQVTVPTEIVERVLKIVQRKDGERKVKKNGINNRRTAVAE